MRVLLDPGHGGSEPGAFYNNTRESALNLRLALLVKGYIHDGEDRNIVMLTRYADYDLPPAERREAIQVPADWFVSIHHNAHSSPDTHGFESFILRNASQEDVELQAKIHEALWPVFGKWSIRDRGPQRKDFRVLTEKLCPGVFLEIGFMSNPAEYRKLIDRQYQVEFAMALADLFRNLKEV